MTTTSLEAGSTAAMPFHGRRSSRPQPPWEATGRPGWTEEETDALRLELATGASSTVVAARLIARFAGRHFSRNAVIGKAIRIGVRRARRRPRRSENTRAELAQIVDRGNGAIELQVVAAPAGCRYGIGHPGQRGFHFCGAAGNGRSLYCDEHHDLCHTRQAADPIAGAAPATPKLSGVALRAGLDGGDPGLGSEGWDTGL